MYSLNNYINTHKKGIKSIKSGTQKQSLNIKLFGISRKQKRIKRNKKRMLAHKGLRHLCLKS